MPIRVVVKVPEWAHDDPFVAMLIREIAILRGTNYPTQRSNHALRPERDDPSRGVGTRPSVPPSPRPMED